MSIKTSMNIEKLDIPEKSEFDKKEYTAFKLRNGLTVLIVSDPSPVPHSPLSSSEEEETDDEDCHSTESTPSESDVNSGSSSSDDGDEKLAACALMVNIGSFSDPPDINGLAHFLEHMIFMGSKKFPKENEFDAYIKKCGGFDNADTECEETSFYFEISEEYLDKALERFVALFTDPLLKKEAMTREREIVESEFISILQDDEMRRDQLLAALSTPGHPCGVFAWGNLKTLKDGVDDDELHKRLNEFRRRNYSAHRMYVCLQARLPLIVLEEMIIKHFSSIPSNDFPTSIDFHTFNNKNAFTEEFYNEVYIIKPVSNICKVELTWCLPSLIKEYKSKPHHYIAYILGYEGSGSLCAYLRKKLWALEMVAGVDDSGFDCNAMYSLFNICIYLTEDGFQHINEVLAATFSYIKLLHNCGPNKALFLELQDIENTTFRFRTERSALDNVENLVVNLKYYPGKHIISGPELYFEYDEEAIWKIIHHLNTFKFNTMVTTKNKFNGILFDKQEKWFGTEYANIKMPKEWIMLWENANFIPELFFPEPNIFISRDFNILWKEMNMPVLSQYPKKIIDDDICELWFRQDEKFLLPTAYMYFYFLTPLPMMSDKNAVLMTLYSLLIKYQLVEQLYPAVVAGLEYQLFSSEKGLVLKASGYNEKLHLVVDIITKYMTLLPEKMDERQLEVFIKQQQRNYYNLLIKPKSLNKDIRLCIVENVRWLMYEKYNLLKDITLSDLNGFCNNLFKEMRIQGLIQGNLAEESARNVMNSILRNFNCSKIANPELLELRARQIPLGKSFVKCRSFNENDVNTVVSNMYQIGPYTLRNQCMLDLLMMFVEEPLFDILRTKEQLGYDVSSCVRNNYGILSYTITVNSQEDKFSATYVEKRIDTFRVEMLNILRTMDVGEYEHIRDSLIKIKQIADNELKDEVSRNWHEITSEEYNFDRNKREIECLKTINKENLIQFCIKESDSVRKLSIQVIGSKQGKASPETDEPCSANHSSFNLKYIKDENTIGDIDIRLCIVENVRWLMYEKYNLLKDITLSDLNGFCNNLFKEMRIQGLIQGNLAEESARNVMNSILRNFNCSKIANPELLELRARQIPLGKSFVKCRSFNENDVNTVVSNMYQIGPYTLRNQCMLDLLMMFVEEPLFDILRTKEQLGYDVSSCVRNNYGILSYTITVNSQEDKFSATYVEKRIDTFRVEMLNILRTMDVGEYEHIRDSLIKIKQIADNELKDEVSRNWHEITSEEYNFDRNEREIECLKAINKENLIQFCIKESDSVRKLSIQVIGSKQGKASPETDEPCSANHSSFNLKYIKDENTIGDIGNFKKDLFLYPVFKTLLKSPAIE